MKITLKEGKVCIDLGDLLYMVWEVQPDEFDQVEFIKKFAWMPQVREEVIRILKEEYSRKSYNEDVHEAREALLVIMKEEEIKFYANVIAKKVEKIQREDRDYWKLFHAVKDHLPDGLEVPKTGGLDIDYIYKLEEMIVGVFEKHLPKQGSNGV